jgi:hypothetical protein
MRRWLAAALNTAPTAPGESGAPTSLTRLSAVNSAPVAARRSRLVVEIKRISEKHTKSPSDLLAMVRMQGEIEDLKENVKAEEREALEAKREADRAGLKQQLESLGNAGDFAGHPGWERGLWGAMKAQGFDVKSHPVAVVSAEDALGVKVASFDGVVGTDTLPRVVPSPGLGADERFLYPRFPVVPVEPDVANVSSFRQASRTLATPANMIRAIDAVSDKPETDTASEVVPLPPLKQVANVSSGIPIILFSNDTLRQWIQGDVELAWRFAVDDMIVDAIGAATTASLTGSPTNVFEEILHARATVAAAGYRPNIVVVSPTDALEIQLLQMTGGATYAFSQQLPEARRHAVGRRWGRVRRRHLCGGHALRLADATRDVPRRPEEEHLHRPLREQLQFPGPPRRRDLPHVGGLVSRVKSRTAPVFPAVEDGRAAGLGVPQRCRLRFATGQRRRNWRRTRPLRKLRKTEQEIVDETVGCALNLTRSSLDEVSTMTLDRRPPVASLLRGVMAGLPSTAPARGYPRSARRSRGCPERAASPAASPGPPADRRRRSPRIGP